MPASPDYTTAGAKMDWWAIYRYDRFFCSFHCSNTILQRTADSYVCLGVFHLTDLYCLFSSDLYPRSIKM